MRPEDDSPSLSGLPKSRWSDEDVVDHDILVDLVRDAIGVLSQAEHEERTKGDPDQRVIEGISERRARFSKGLRELRIADAVMAERLRGECLAIIRGEAPWRGNP